MDACPVCNSKNLIVFMRGIYDCDSTSVMECSDCGMQFLDPLMSEQAEQEYYEGYYRKQKDRHFKAMDLADLQQRALQHYEQYSSVYLELIAGAKNILEIGSGTGGFLRFVRQHCPDAKLTALERDKENVNFLRECFSQDVALIDSLSELQDRKFDLIVGLGVFEHVRNSREFLANLRGHLSGKGALALNVPNKENALIYVYGLDEFKKFSYMKQHYYTFTERSLELLAAETGLVIDRFNYMQVWGLDNHLSWLRHRRPRDFSDITAYLSPETLDSYNRDLIGRKMTDLFMAVFSTANQDR